VVIVEFFRAIRDSAADGEFVARLIADGADLRVEGPEPELVDRNQPVVSLRDGATLTCADNPEEWARGLAASFRTPYLIARIVEDTDPLADVEIARTEVKERIYR
jgi:hypothetical protein